MSLLLYRDPVYDVEQSWARLEETLRTAHERWRDQTYDKFVREHWSEIERQAEDHIAPTRELWDLVKSAGEVIIDLESSGR